MQSNGLVFVALELIFDEKARGVFVTDQSTKDVLVGGYFGVIGKDRLDLEPEEGLYLIDVRHASCKSQQSGKEMSFNDIATKFSSVKNSWQDISLTRTGGIAGLIIKRPDGTMGGGGKAQLKRYNASLLKLKTHRIERHLLPC